MRRKTEPEHAARWLETVVSQMRDMWVPHNGEADGLLADESAHLKENGKKKPRPPDNFMGKDLADVVQDRYQRVFGSAVVNGDVKQLDRGIYAALSRDSHARLRIEAAALTILPDGTVRVIPLRIDETSRRRTLLHCLESSLAEAVGAVSYLLEARGRADAEKLRWLAGRASADDLRPGFNPDLGLHLARSGGAATAFNFFSVPIQKLGVLPNGTACWSASLVLGDREYIATFDVPPVLRNDLARAVGILPAVLQPSREIVKHNFEGLPRVGLECTLGELQRNAKETFVPLVVRRVVAEVLRG